jgi:hypothetical protein
MQIINAKGGEPCRVCFGASGFPTTFHHLVPRGAPWFGADTEANLVGLCGTGTTGCHGLVERRDEKACRTMLERLRDDEYSYAIERGGEAFFERRYRLVYSRA